MLNDTRIRKLVDYENSADVFNGVDIAGGICYFLWERDYVGECTVVNNTGHNSNQISRRLNEYPIFIRSNKAVSIVRKVLQKETSFLDQTVLTQKPFGLRTFARGKNNTFSGAVKLLSSQGWSYISRHEVTKNSDGIDKYKIIVGRLVPSNGELDVKPGTGYRVITQPRILKPGEINTESYITLGVFNTEQEATNFKLYIKGKFSRFLLRQAVSSVNINRDVFKFVPSLDFTKTWDDQNLYRIFELSEDEISYIEETIRDFEVGGDDSEQ
jgi:site-specific DNA-methyltransferase (adenine-specific)